MSDDEPVGYDGFGAPIYPHQEAPMPTELPPGFKGTGKRSTPNPEIPVRVNIPDSQSHKAEPTEDDFPTWAKVLTLAVCIIGSWALVAGVFWCIKQLFELAARLAS